MIVIVTLTLREFTLRSKSDGVNINCVSAGSIDGVNVISKSVAFPAPDVPTPVAVKISPTEADAGPPHADQSEVVTSEILYFSPTTKLPEFISEAPTIVAIAL